MSNIEYDDDDDRMEMWVWNLIRLLCLICWSKIKNNKKIIYMHVC